MEEFAANLSCGCIQKMSKKIRWICILLLALGSQIFGQTGVDDDGEIQALTKVLTMEAYLEIVEKNHPVFFQAGQLGRMAQANMMMSRGGLDPKFNGDWNAKSFDGKEYYNLLDLGIKVPTWIGVDVKAGYERSTGVFLDNSDELPDAGLYYAGISVPLGKGLLIDDRRTAIRQAKIFQESTEQVQVQMKNRVTYQALLSYLDWQESYFHLQVAQEGVDIAESRFDASVVSFQNGDKPAIDTLESLISVQNRVIQLRKAEQDYVKAVYELNNFLWIQGETPLELEDQTVPEEISEERFEREIDSLYLVKDLLLSKHPDILSYDYKISDLELERRLAVESLKPDVRVEYNPLYESQGSFLPRENYKLGLFASYPLLVRKERGKIGMLKAKIAETGYDLDMETTKIRNKIEVYYNLQQQIGEQNLVLNRTVENYRRLVEAENLKFSIGESSIFLLNSREVNYLESRNKLIAGRSNQLRTRAIFLFASGLIYEVN